MQPTFSGRARGRRGVVNRNRLFLPGKKRAGLQEGSDCREKYRLNAAIEALSLLCEHGHWITEDPLGLGGLLFDAGRLCQLPGEATLNDVRLLEELIDACHNGLIAFLAGRQLSRPASHRLAFRELGLAIGLRALTMIADVISKDRTRFGNRTSLGRAVHLLLPYKSLSETIVNFWMPHAQHHDASWLAHQNINGVMLATALIPDTFLSIGRPRLP